MEEKQENTHQVIQPGLQYNTSWMVKDVPPPTEPTEYEKKILEGTMTPKQLIEIEKKEKEEEEKKEKEMTEEEKLEMFKKEFIQKVKVIALDKLGYYPLSNPSLLTQNEKNKIIKKMDKILKNNKIDSIENEFNRIIQAILVDPKTEYDKLPRKYY